MFIRRWCYYSRRSGRAIHEEKHDPSFPKNAIKYCLEEAGATQGHYFWQDLWAAKYLFDNNTTTNRRCSDNVESHVDVGSRLDGFIAHILPFCRVTYVDIRPLNTEIAGLEFKQGSILEMPFDTDSIKSLSSLHVLEHIGLGRYGDPVNAAGYIKAAKELVRVLAIGGKLLLSTPVGRERLCFNAHRIFDPQTVVDIFGDL